MAKQIKVTIEMGSEIITTSVDEGATVQALIEDGHLRGIEAASTRLNGAPASPGTPLQDGDSVSQVPKSGRQGVCGNCGSSTSCCACPFCCK